MNDQRRIALEDEKAIINDKIANLEERMRVIAKSLQARLSLINTEGILSDEAIFRCYYKEVEGLRTPTVRGWLVFKTKTCPDCGVDLVSAQLEEIWHGPMSLTQHWRFIYYNCPECEYEWGEWI